MSLTFKSPLQMGQKEVSLLLIKNICFSVERPFVMCYDYHTVGHRITKISLPETSFYGAFAFHLNTSYLLVLYLSPLGISREQNHLLLDIVSELSKVKSLEQKHLTLYNSFST